MGMPLCLFAFGIKGLAIATAITSTILILHFSLGILLASRKFSIQPLIKCVPVYAILFSLFFVYYKIPAPKFLENATFLIGYSAIFLVLVSLGVALSKLKVFSFKETLIYSLIRVLVGPIIGFAFVKYLNLTGVEAGVMFIQASMPSAILTYLVAEMYSPKEITDSIASTVALSTFLSLFTLVLIVFLALKYFS
jgi:predicted permease